MERGQPPPSWVEEEPACPPPAEAFLRAFWQLSTERQIGFTIGQIPVSKIEEYGEKRGFDSVTLDILKQMVRALDTAFLEWVAKEREKDGKRKR